MLTSIHVTAGELPIGVVRVFCMLRHCGDRQKTQSKLDLTHAGPGFTLPTNIGDLDAAIYHLNLSRCQLTGAVESA